MMRIFSDALRRKMTSGKTPVISDIKRISPKAGDLFGGRSAADIAKILQSAGAPALSVVTEPKNYCGSLHMLESVAAATGLPVLRKDFISSERDLADTKNAGAAAVLLICSMHPPDELNLFFQAAHALGLEVLLETHTAGELNAAVGMGAQLIGVNNRDILSLEMDDGTVSTSETLLRGIKKSGQLLISESGIFTPQDVRRAVCAGADAVLVGTAILRARNTAAFYRSLEQEVF